MSGLKKYDYIIAGAGAAGLSLLMHFMQNQYFNDKRILVIDKTPKETNDRTWCFWEQQAGLFEPVVHHSWGQVNFYSDYYSSLLDLSPYTYKMIRGIDFYQFVMQQAACRDNITFKYEAVDALANDINAAGVIVNGEKISAEYVFNSIMFAKPEVPAGKYFMLQHFKGWLVETQQNLFDPGFATLMDFRTSQQNGTTFFYVLPVAPNKALVEYTLFSKSLLQPTDYDAALENYMLNRLQCQHYSVTEQEFGIIPMTNMKFLAGIGRIINIGTAGGQTKASSGYTFRFIQKQSKAIVNSFNAAGHPFVKKTFSYKRFNLYDSTLLNILQNNKMGGAEIFANLFKKNPPPRVLKFLDNESSLEDELNIMGSVPPGLFIKAAFQEMFR